MKYRKLSLEELEELKDDFVRFLASNQITATDWERLKNDDPDNAGALIGLFSDMVFEQVLARATYLEFRTPHDLKTFHCLPDKILMLGLMVDEGAGIDFSKNQNAAEMSALLQSAGASLKLYSAEKNYTGSREEELFRMLEHGCLISREGEMYKLLEELKNGISTKS
ncbi:MAG: DUF6495 family protein [Saprospiraceae bacterium]